MLETPRIPHYSWEGFDRCPSYSENVSGADNQQERLDGYLAGYVDGEGSFSVVVNRNPTCRSGFQLVPEFHVSQNPERASILELLQVRLGCGRIRPNARAGGRDRSLVYVVRRREDLMDKVIPFFRAHPILSEKRLEFETFAAIVAAMENREHLSVWRDSNGYSTSPSQ